jgi:hypothetical protein
MTLFHTAGKEFFTRLLLHKEKIFAENLLWSVSMPKDPREMTNEEVQKRIVRLGFCGDEQSFQAFCEKLKADLPTETAVVLRGSVITNERYEDGGPFDENGAGTSDLDVTLIGNKVMDCWDKEAFYIPKLHTKPLGDKDPEIAPALNPLRQELQKIAKRPVNFQATANFILFIRDVLFDQPYFILIDAEEKS